MNPQPTRRRFLRGAGVALALPALESLGARTARAEAPPRRLLAICNNLGLLTDSFFPSAAGRDYALPPYLELLREHRDAFTVMSGVWHPDCDGGHPADNCFLTAAPHPSSGGFHNTISLDQLAARYIGHLTRFPSLTLGVNIQRGLRSLSWTPGGVAIPCDESPAAVFRRLFINGRPDEVAAQIRRLERGASIMDAVAGQVHVLDRGLSGRDHDRLDQYLSAVRDLEGRLQKTRAWEDIPRPKITVAPPVDPPSSKQYFQKLRLFYDLVRLAFETDSTRLVTLMLDGVNSPVIEVPDTEITDNYHNLSHHGKAPDKLAQLAAIDREHFKALGSLFGGLASVREGGDTLFDRTMVLYGSNFGSASAHTTTNLPVLLAGGGFRHGQHLAFDRERNYPLPNLFVTMLHRLGIEVDRFASSTGTMRGLDLA